MGAKAEVAGVLDRFRSGWEEHDIDAVLSCFADADDTVVIGTDAGEYWRGYRSFAEPFRAMSSAFGEARYTWLDGPVIGVEGERAWADGLLGTVLIVAGETVEAKLRTTWLLRRGLGGWQVTQAHFSVAPDAPVAAY
jgi:ketosteroid isomerase-like protein